MVNHRGVCSASLVQKELGVLPASERQANGLEGWEYERMQHHAWRNNPAVIQRRLTLRTKRALDSKAAGDCNTKHAPTLRAPAAVPRKYDINAAVATLNSSSSSLVVRDSTG